MSLKAKIEAVIYASEEPVTLAQLMSLLGNEAQAELDATNSAQTTLELGETNPAPEEDSSPSESQPPPSDPESPSADSPKENEPASLPSLDKQAVREQKLLAQRLRTHFRTLLDQLVADYATGDRGLEIREVAGGYRLATKPEYHDAVRGFITLGKPPLKFTKQALETLAVIAYKQPVTAPEIADIRGVDSAGVLGSLLARKLIATAGRKQVIGRPILYKTTRDFLLSFGLRDVSDLPSIEEFEKMAGELADLDTDAAPASPLLQEQTPMPELPQQSTDRLPTAELEEELGEDSEPQADGDSTAIDTVPVDGRISGLPPRYNETEKSNSPAEDADVQNDTQGSEAR